MNNLRSTPTRARAGILRLADSVVGPPVLLLGAAIAGLLWVNLHDHSYAAVWEQTLTIGLGGQRVSEDLQGWVNDGLMALFFFGVGLEVKRELVVGELRDRRHAALPAIAALGGMIVPAALFAMVNLVIPGGDSSGWAIPVATDIAFTLGVLSLLGPRVPPHLRLFVLTLAIADDVGGVLIIAIGFSDDVSLGNLGAAVIVLALLLLQRSAGFRAPIAYVPLGIVLWYLVSKAGIEPTIAGVVLGVMTPAHPVRGRPVLEELETLLRPITALVVLPLFALANTGIRVNGTVIGETIRSPVAAGVVIGLVVGKTVGITLATRAAVRLRLGSLHESVDPRLIAPAALLAGIGFTVSLFIAELTFDDPARLDQAKLGILAGSVIAGALGTVAFRTIHRNLAADQAAP